MTIKNVCVRYPRNVITYMPAWMCGALNADSAIISIAYEGERRPLFLSTQSVLELTDHGCGLTPEDFHKALRFVKEHLGRNINIHCLQGRIRSKTLATQLATVIPQYRVLEHRPEGELYSMHPDRLKRARVKTLSEVMGNPGFHITAKEFTEQTLQLRSAAKALVILEDSDQLPQ